MRATAGATRAGLGEALGPRDGLLLPVKVRLTRGPDQTVNDWPIGRTPIEYPPLERTLSGDGRRVCGFYGHRQARGLSYFARTVPALGSKNVAAPFEGDGPLPFVSAWIAIAHAPSSRRLGAASPEWQRGDQERSQARKTGRRCRRLHEKSLRAPVPFGLVACSGSRIGRHRRPTRPTSVRQSARSHRG